MAALITSTGTTPNHRLLRRGERRAELSASTRSVSPMRSPRSPLSPPACSRRFRAIRCPSTCTRGRAGGSRRHRGTRRSRRRHRIARNHGGRGGYWPGDGRGSGLGACARHARRGFPYHTDDFQEPRLLRPRLCRRRRPCAEGADGRGRRGDRARARREATARAGGGGDADPATPAEARFSTPYLVARAHARQRAACAFETGVGSRTPRRARSCGASGGPRPEIDAHFRHGARRRRDRIARRPARGALSAYAQGATRTCTLSDVELEEKYLESPRRAQGRNARAGCSPRLWRLERERTWTQEPRAGVFAPAPVALVGASATRRRTARAFALLRKHGYAGRIVRSRVGSEVLGERALRNLAEAPGAIEPRVHHDAGFGRARDEEE